MLRLDEFFSGHPLAILAGAGISMDAPSNLLPGARFVDGCLSAICPDDVDREWLLSIMRLPAGKFARPGEFARFEMLMGELAQSGVDPELTVLRCLDECASPNRNHFVCAGMIRRGAVVMTTNFDSLIELAYERTRSPGEPELAVAYLDEQFAADPPLSASRPTLWKLHGSLSVGGRATGHSLQATLTSVMSSAMSPRKTAFLGKVLASHDLLLIGYSGADDLDLVPVLGNIPSSRRILWINHSPAGSRIRNAGQWREDSPVSFESDAVGQLRVCFTLAPDGSIIRDDEQIWIAEVPTADACAALTAKYGLPAEYPPGEPYRIDAPDYFAAWAGALDSPLSTRYEFIRGIFANRSFRQENQRALAHVAERITRLRSDVHATLNERVSQLIEDFNGAQHMDEVAAVRHRLLGLWPSLRQETRAIRLRACVEWSMEGRSQGERWFQRAVAVARERGDRREEISTLVTWRGYAGFSQWSELFWDLLPDPLRKSISPGYVEARRREARSIHGALPEAESRRFIELGRELGWLPLLHQHTLLALRDVLDDDGPMIDVNAAQVHELLRYAIDAGDVMGEMQALVVLGRLYLLAGEPGLAAEELFRAVELGRIVSAPNVQAEALSFLGYAQEQIGPEYLERLAPVIRRSMWRH